MNKHETLEGENSAQSGPNANNVDAVKGCKSATEFGADDKKHKSDVSTSVKEVGGPKGLEPTRYGDWESKGRCYDF